MYTWGYIKENTLAKLNLDEEQANQLSFLSRFPFYANEAMTQICSSVKPRYKTFDCTIKAENSRETENDLYVGDIITMPEDFIGFGTGPVAYKRGELSSRERSVMDMLGFSCTDHIDDVGDDFIKYIGYNQIICKIPGNYKIPYKARWFFFTKDLEDSAELKTTDGIWVPADICDAIPSYIVGQCYKIDDEAKAAIYRNEFETFLARMDDTNFESQRTFHIGGGW